MVAWLHALDRTSWQQECVTGEILCLLVDREQRQEGAGDRLVPTDLLPPLSPHLPKFLELPKTVSPTRDLSFKT
jgi:hypothetical protein